MTFRADFDHHDELLRASVEEFSDHGYDTASINRILNSAGMSKGQLYHHFSNKEGLYLALVEWMIDQKVTWFSSNPVELEGDFANDVTALIGASVKFAVEHPDIDRLSRALLAERGRPIYTTVVRRFGFESDSALGALVDRHFEQGEFRAELSLEFVRRAVLILINNLAELFDLDEAAGIEPRIDELGSFLRVGLTTSSGR